MTESVQMTKSLQNKHNDHDTLKSKGFVNEHFNWKNCISKFFVSFSFEEQRVRKTEIYQNDLRELKRSRFVSAFRRT